MAFRLFKKKEAKEPGLPDLPPPPGGAPAEMPPAPSQPAALPTDQVLSLRQQGLSNNQIIQTLQRQGYPPQDISDAFAQADAQAAIGPAPYPEEMPPGPDMMMEGPPAPQGQTNEELVESIVEEKWREMQGHMGKFSGWQEETGSRIDKLEQSMQDIKADLDNLHKAIVSKIGEYDKNLLDVGTEIKAMEKVFQQVLPELTGSVAELSRITTKVKQKPMPKKATKK